MINEYVVVDLEMTGLSAKEDQIIEIGAVRIKDNQKVACFECLVNPKCSIPSRVVELTGITDEMAKEGRDKDEAVAQLLDFIGDSVLVGQNIGFDYSFLKQWAVNHKRPLDLQACDTLRIARVLLPATQPKNLEALCAYFEIERNREHRALDDAIETWQVFERLKEIVRQTKKNEELFVPKPLFYKAKKQTPATKHQLQRLREYMEKHNIKEEIAWDNLTRSQASRIMDQYISIYGR